VIVGLIALNASVVGLATLLYRLAWSPWVFPSGPRLWRARAVFLWLLPAVAFFGVYSANDTAPQWPSVLVAVSAAIAAWLMHRYRFIDRHGSQAVKLLLSFLAVALPSIILYPSLVDASERARRQLIETRYAPEVINQRQELRLKLQKALAEIDRIVALDDLVRASDPPVAGPPSTDAAFLVWSQTSLATERLTSSVELHNASGAMVSRFAMNLPDFAQPQPWIEPSCDWDMLEEVSPLFSEERRLLHAGKALCIARGRRAGSVVVHSMLDYGNLSFISAQNPYVALVRSQSRPQPRPRADVEFVVYGWSRRVLYSSDEAAPPLPEGAFRRAYESRTPFWATRALAMDLAAEMSPKRTAVEVAARDPLRAIACARRCRSSPISRPAIAGATRPETVTPSHAESRSISSLQRPKISYPSTMAAMTSRPVARESSPDASATGMLSLGCPPRSPALAFT